MTKVARYCDQCKESYTVPACAPHKKFCSTHCRNAWHYAQRDKAFGLLRKQEQEQEPNT